MDLLMIVLRLFHIFAGIFWVGTTFFLEGFLQPTVRAAGPEGGQFMQRLVRNTRITQVMPLVALLTTLSGVLMFWRASGELYGPWLASARGVVLTVGSLAGIAAFVIGLFFQSPASRRMAQLAGQIAAAGGPPTPEQGMELEAMQRKLAQGSLYTTVLMVIAVVGMAAARYL